MASEHQLEVLNDAHQAFLRADLERDPRGFVRCSNVLFDACLRAGMDFDEPDHEAWAAERVTQWLVAA